MSEQADEEAGLEAALQRLVSADEQFATMAQAVRVYASIVLAPAGRGVPADMESVVFDFLEQRSDDDPKRLRAIRRARELLGVEA